MRLLITIGIARARYICYSVSTENQQQVQFGGVCMIHLVTHNGLPRAKGGLFIGYIYVLNNGGLASVPAGLLKPLVADLPPAVTPALARVQRHGFYKDAECPKCGYNNGSKTYPIQPGVRACSSCCTSFEVYI